MPKPGSEEHQIEKPTNDNEYFERMSRIIFMSGLNWATLQKKWPGIRSAFDDFDIGKVSEFDEAKVDSLMSNPDVIRNLPKIRAIVRNAEQMREIIDQSGSVQTYLATLEKKGEDAMRAEISKKFSFMGPGTTVIFLHSIGTDLPKATKEWQDRHSQ